jgi:adenosine 3'-phospho 5'-phosphosulfate transporter B2
MQENPESFTYNLISAFCGTTGQFFIYTTIKEFGPVVFTIIMTTRQMLSMVFSTFYFGHTMDSTSYLAVILVFGTVFYSVKRRKDAKDVPKEANKKIELTQVSSPNSGSN